MWPATFSSRLKSWNLLRDQCLLQSPEQALSNINSWWFCAPWTPYYLHWDDLPNWPNPWQLLNDNVYCEVARGLGILYTITLLGREDMAPIRLVLTEDGSNLVLAAKEKYILNWEPDNIVNTNRAVKIKKCYQQESIA